MSLDPRVRQAVRTIVSRFNSGENPGGLSLVVDLATLIASADGMVDPDEVAAIRETSGILLGEELGFDVVRVFVSSCKANIERVGIEASAHQIGAAFAANGIAKEGAVLAVGIALASEGLSKPERGVIDWIAASAGIAAAEIDAIIEALASPSDAVPVAR